MIKTYRELIVWQKSMKLVSAIYRITKNEIKQYLANIRKDYSNSYYNIIGSSIKIMFDKVLNQPNKMIWFKPIKTERKFVNIISFNEFRLMMGKTEQIKHKLIIIIFYSTGIRLSELLNIKLSDIDWLNKRIFIRTSKNGKNRFVQLHKILEKYIIAYRSKWNPIKYLIEGSPGIKYTDSSVQKIIKKVSDSRFHPHIFRHTYITNMVEKVDIFAAKELAGHRSLKSTLHYNHIALDRLNAMYNPLDNK